MAFLRCATICLLMLWPHADALKPWVEDDLLGAEASRVAEGDDAGKAKKWLARELGALQTLSLPMGVPVNLKTGESRIVFSGPYTDSVQLQHFDGCTEEKVGATKVLSCSKSSQAGDLPEITPVNGAITFQEGDHVALSVKTGVSGIPFPFSKVFPKELPGLNLDCQLCGGTCDMRLQAMNKAGYDLWTKVVYPAWSLSAKLQGKKLENPMDEFTGDFMLKKMPPCPWVAKDAIIPETLMEIPGSEGHESQALESSSNTINEMMPNIHGWTETKVSWMSKNGTMLLTIDVTGRG